MYSAKCFLEVNNGVSGNNRIKTVDVTGGNARGRGTINRVKRRYAGLFRCEHNKLAERISEADINGHS